MPIADFALFCLVLGGQRSRAASAAAQLPNQDGTDSPRPCTDRYVMALEDWADKTPDFMKRSEAAPYITLVAAHLLAYATPFRWYEQECWMFFEDARRALVDSKTRSAKQSARAWDTCLAMRQDGLRAAAKPFMRCLR